MEDAEIDIAQELEPRIIETICDPAVSAETRIDRYLAEAVPEFSRSRHQGLIAGGYVTLNGAPVTRANRTIAPGDTIRISLPPPIPAEPVPEAIPLAILHEDDHIIVINKPSGMVVHPAPGHPSGTVVNALLHHCPSLPGIGGVVRPGIVHRLDQDTTGVLAAAKTEDAMRVMANEFASHANMEKVYLALVHGIPSPPSGTLETLIGRHPKDRKRMAIVPSNGKRAVTRYKVLNSANGVALVECEIETGRTHQIRVHLASLGTPVLGDMQYGIKRLDRALATPPSRQLLHAFKLSLKHPITREPKTFIAPTPADFFIPPLAVRTALALGSNMGDRAAFLAAARNAIAQLPATRILSESTIIETKGVDVPAQFADADFLNQVIIAESLLEVHDFSRRIHLIETALGRTRNGIRNSPRYIDIDIITFGDLRLEDPSLTLPHPRAAERAFVQIPLRDALAKLALQTL